MRSWKQSFTVLWIAEFLAIAGFSTSNPIIPLFLQELGVGDAVGLNWWTGAINSIPALTFAVFAPIWGSLADGYGRKLMLLRAMIAGSVLVGLLALATSPWQVLLLKTLQGCLTGTVTAATVLVAGIVPVEEAGYRLGLLQMAVFLGSSVGPLFGGVITDLSSARLSFVATAIILAAAAVLVASLVDEAFTRRPRTGSFLRNALPDFGIFSQNRAIVPLFAATFAVQLANATAGPILPLVVLDMTKGGAGVASLSGLVIGAGAAAAAIAAAAIGKISGRLGYARTLIACVAGGAAFMVLQGFARTPYVLLAFRVGAGICLGGTIPSMNALVAAVGDKSRQGATYGLMSSVSSVGMALGPVLGASVASGLGYPAVFFATGLVLAGVAATAGPSALRASRPRDRG